MVRSANKDKSVTEIVEIPTVDISDYVNGRPDGARNAADQLRFAMEQVGFFFLVGHGIDWTIVERAYAESRRFFELPLGKKMEIKVGTGGADSVSLLQEKRGYIYYNGREAPNSSSIDSRSKNYVEAMNMTRDDYGINQWPSDLPGFKEVMLSYYDMMYRLASDLLPLYARALDLPDDYFGGFFDQPDGGVRLSHYIPAESEQEVRDSWGIRPHTDRTFMTLLPANIVEGLQVRPEGKQWIDAPYIAQSFVVNGGDILRRWTNDHFLSTPHRVTRSMRERYAMPFFFSPSLDVAISSVPSRVTADNPDRYRPVVHSDFRAEFFTRGYESSDNRLQN